jgi:hypothetical protein
MADGLPTTSPAPRAASPPVDLRPLTTSELIDRGFSLYRAHFTGFLLLALLCQIAPLMSQILITTFKLAPSLDDVNSAHDTILHKALPLSVIFVVTQLVVFSFEIIITFFVADAYLGKTPSVVGSMRRFAGCVGLSVKTCLLNIGLIVATLIFPVLAWFALYFYDVFYTPIHTLSLVLFCVAALMLFVVSVVPLLLVFMRLMVTVPVVTLENLGGWKAIRRSFEIVGYNPGLGIFYWGAMRLSFLLLPLFVIELMVLMVTSLPLTIHQVGEAFRNGSGGQLAPPADISVVISQVLTFVAVSVILPLYAIATTLFYYDVRIRREGFDLEFMAGKLGGRA